MQVKIVFSQRFAVVGNIKHTALQIIVAFEDVYNGSDNIVGIDNGVVIGIDNLLSRTVL